MFKKLMAFTAACVMCVGLAVPVGAANDVKIEANMGIGNIVSCYVIPGVIETKKFPTRYDAKYENEEYPTQFWIPNPSDGGGDVTVYVVPSGTTIDMSGLSGDYWQLVAVNLKDGKLEYNDATAWEDSAIKYSAEAVKRDSETDYTKLVDGSYMQFLTEDFMLSMLLIT